MAYKIRFQRNDLNPPSYQYNKYGTGTIRSSACGPSALVNCLLNQKIADVSIPTMCSFSVSVGARIPNSGTDESILIKHAASKYGFTYKTTSKNAELVEHLKNNGTAVCWNGGGYPLFSTGGHYVAAIGIDSSGYIIIADSLYYGSKWSANSTRKSQIHTTSQTGIVKVSITALGKATADRAPSYFLISKKEAIKTTTESVNTKAEVKKEDDEMVEKTKFNIAGKTSEINAITKNGTTYVELRDYNDKLGLVTDYKNGVRTVDTNRVKVNVEGKDVSVPGVMISDKNFIAIRDAFEAAGYTVGWNNSTQTVTLTKK